MLNFSLPFKDILIDKRKDIFFWVKFQHNCSLNDESKSVTVWTVLSSYLPLFLFDGKNENRGKKVVQKVTLLICLMLSSKLLWHSLLGLGLWCYQDTSPRVGKIVYYSIGITESALKFWRQISTNGEG